MTPNSTVFLDPQVKKADWAYVTALPAASHRALPAPVHIVTCAFARVALLQEVCFGRLCAMSEPLTHAHAPPRWWISDSRILSTCTNNKPQVLAANIEAQDLGGPDGPPVYLHLCNNNPDPTQHAYIEAVLRNVTGLAGYRLQTFPDNPVRGYACVEGD